MTGSWGCQIWDRRESLSYPYRTHGEVQSYRAHLLVTVMNWKPDMNNTFSKWTVHLSSEECVIMITYKLLNDDLFNKIVKVILVTDTSKDRAIGIAEQHIGSNEANRRIVQIEEVIVKTTNREQKIARV